VFWEIILSLGASEGLLSVFIKPGKLKFESSALQNYRLQGDKASKSNSKFVHNRLNVAPTSYFCAL
jgi:hypothetical protein